MSELRISPDLAFGLDAVTQKFAWLGRTGSGKTFACKRFVEQMLHAGVQVVVLDSVGVWYGLRQGPKGFDVPVLGGIYGDIPLDPSSGALVAEVVVSHGSSLVLDLSQMSDAGRARFAAAFGARLFELKKQNPGAMHLVLDEGQDYVPQDPEKSENLMLHEWVRIAKQGRAFGMGLSIVSQRPQEISKKALNQAECVLAFQLTGPHERKALEYWLADKGLETKLSTTLTTLEVGRPFVWSPQWLKMSQVIERVLPIESADTSQTPKVGDGPRLARAMKPIDLGQLRASMEAATAEAQQNDPALLKAEVKRLREQLAAGAEPPVSNFDWKITRDFLAATEERKKLRAEIAYGAVGIVMDLEEICRRLHGVLDGMKSDADNDSTVHAAAAIFATLQGGRAMVAISPAISPRPTKQERQKAKVQKAAPEPPPRFFAAGASEIKLERVDRLLLQVLAQHGTMALPRAAMLAGYPSTTSTTRNSAIRLRGLGLIDGKNSGLSVTAAGRAVVGKVEKLPKAGKELLEYWCDRLDKVDAQILRVLARSREPLLYAPLATAAGYEPAKSTAKNAVIRLRGLGLVSGKNTEGITIRKELRP